MSSITDDETEALVERVRADERARLAAVLRMAADQDAALHPRLARAARALVLPSDPAEPSARGPGDFAHEATPGCTGGQETDDERHLRTPHNADCARLANMLRQIVRNERRHAAGRLEAGGHGIAANVLRSQVADPPARGLDARRAQAGLPPLEPGMSPERFDAVCKRLAAVGLRFPEEVAYRLGVADKTLTRMRTSRTRRKPPRPIPEGLAQRIEALLAEAERGAGVVPVEDTARRIARDLAGG